MKHDPGQSGDASDAPNQRHVTSESNVGKARKWFAHAKKAAETKNYDYAVELYVNGLGLWPDAVDEGLKLLRVVATARRLNGGKPAGFLEGKKYPTGGKDVLKALNNAIYLFGKDPTSVPHMEAILQSAAAAHCDRTVQWVSPVLVEALASADKKLGEKHYSEACAAMESAADIATAAGDHEGAIEILQAALRVSQIWTQHYPDSSDGQRGYSSASSKLTIVKGRFQSADDFTESLKDAGEQRDIRDRDKMVRTVDRTDELTERARRDWADNPETPGKLIALVDLLSRRDTDEADAEAIAALEKDYAAHANYAMKAKADDMRIRQLRRRGRAILVKIKADPRDRELRQQAARHMAAQQHAEIAIYRDRLSHYPTDHRVRFELATRLFKARQYDEAIPLFQQAQADGRHRNECRLYIGRCLFEKEFFSQATETLQAAYDELELKTGDMGKDLQYWLARSLEADGDVAAAKKAYGHLIQLDYNYGDARERLEALARSEKGGAAQDG